MKIEFMNNIPYLLALHSINGLGPIRLKALVDYFQQDFEAAWEGSSKELLSIGIPRNVVSLLEETRKKLDPENYAESIKKSGINWVTIFDEDYPNLLKEIYDPPLVLYFKGELPKNFNRSIAVVGTRKVSGYGKLVTEKFAYSLAEAGLVVVSGLARGVDTIAHRVTVAAKGKTVAVLGGGLNKIFPPENIALAMEIAKGFGAVVSEFPPDNPSLAGNFPARNRIISGLSRGVLVTEAAEDSGSLITAKCALEQGRDVFAIPGPITSDLSKGPALLLKQGARLVTEPEEILEELGLERMRNEECKMQNVQLSEVEERILQCLSNENKHIDEICRDSNLSIAAVSASLIKMEIQGLVKNLGGGSYVKCI